VERGYGSTGDLLRIEDNGLAAGALADAVSEKARTRQRQEMGTLGSGNHYLEVQEVVEVADDASAAVFGLRKGEIVVSIHCGSRGLGHQIATDYQREMAIAMPQLGISVPDLDLACAPIRSQLGQRYLGAMRAAINCAFANRQILTHLTRRVFGHFFPQARLDLLFDVSHNTCKQETHRIAGGERSLFVHRKGATRAFGPGHTELPAAFRNIGQPVFIGGSMGTQSAIMAGTGDGAKHAFASACHGAGRQLSRHQALGAGTVVRSSMIWPPPASSCAAHRRAVSLRKRRGPTRISPQLLAPHMRRGLLARWQCWHLSSVSRVSQESRESFCHGR
jgi:tRNA-splicing ligase RtcB